MSTAYEPVTEADYLAVKKLGEDYWSQFPPPPNRYTGKIKDLGITDEQYNAAGRVIWRYEVMDKGNISSHTLAHYLLQFPDCPVVGIETGQSSNEGGDDDLKSVDHKLYGSQNCITLSFGPGPATR
jgi:hypothetical protein